MALLKKVFGLSIFCFLLVCCSLSDESQETTDDEEDSTTVFTGVDLEDEAEASEISIEGTARLLLPLVLFGSDLNDVNNAGVTLFVDGQEILWDETPTAYYSEEESQATFDLSDVTSGQTLGFFVRGYSGYPNEVLGFETALSDTTVTVPLETGAGDAIIFSVIPTLCNRVVACVSGSSLPECKINLLGSQGLSNTLCQTCTDNQTLIGLATAAEADAENFSLADDEALEDCLISLAIMECSEIREILSEVVDHDYTALSTVLLDRPAQCGNLFVQ